MEKALKIGSFCNWKFSAFRWNVNVHFHNGYWISNFSKTHVTDFSINIHIAANK